MIRLLAFAFVFLALGCASCDSSSSSPDGSAAVAHDGGSSD